MIGFDPQNNLFDHRVLFEVTGQSLHPDEFLDEDCSDEEYREAKEGPDPDNPLDWRLF